MSDKFEKWVKDNQFFATTPISGQWVASSGAVISEWNAALSGLQGEAVAEFGGHRHTPKDTTEFFGWMCDSNFRLKAGAKLFTYPPSAAAKIAELEAKLAEVEKDAERYNWLCDHCVDFEDSFTVKSLHFEYSPNLYLHQAIDAAIQESKKGGVV